MEIETRLGFDANDRKKVADLFWQAFSGKLNVVLGPEGKAKRFLCKVLDPNYAISAYSREEGALLGVAGFKTDDGAMVGGTFSDPSAHYGFWSAIWRGVLADQLERPIAPGELCMDGIFVTSHARGKGVGTLLLKAVQAEATARSMTSVRLDVIDTNPRARKLYERFGFMPQNTTRTGVLRPVFGFASSTRMTLTL
ncbi:MAG: GNAT family N-acetyltransferase [Paracoccaceae bacterium]